MYEYDDDAYRPDGGQPFGQQPPFGGPPFGGPPFGQQPPFGGAPFGGGQGFGPPSGPPPAFEPSMAQMGGFGIGGPTVFAIDPGAIRPCSFRFVFIVLENGRRFWAWLTFVGRRSIAGWRWNGFRWVFFGIDLDDIRAFFCQ
jgi:hypothetical protein